MRKLILSILGISLFLVHNATAGGFQINSQSIKAMGMGGALTGRVFDAGTVFFNPGGMTALEKKTVINAGISAYLPRTSFLGAENQQVEDDSPLSLPYHLYFSTRLKNESLSVGLSINTPFGYNSQWKDDWTGRFIARSFSIRTIFIQPTAAYKIDDHWSVGAGPIIANGGLTLTRALPFTNINGKESSVDLSGNGTSFGVNAGVYYVNGKLSAGVSYRSGVKIGIDEGDATFNDIPAFLTLNGTYPASTTFSTELNIPAVISLAGGYALNDKLTFTLGFNLTQWSVVESIDFDLKQVTLEDIRTVRKYENTLSFRAGIEGKLSQKLIFRGGIALDQSPVPDNYLSPDIPDGDKTIISTGLTWKMIENFSLDGSFMFENVRERRETDNQPYNFNGTYNSFIYIAGIGAQFTF